MSKYKINVNKKKITQLKNNLLTYTMFIPGFIILFIFCYLPIVGLLIMFKNYSPNYGIVGSEFVWFKNFISLFEHPYFWMMTLNTVGISFFKFITGFPASILFAILLNEMRTKGLKKGVQTVSYLPNFISWVTIGGMLFSILSLDDGFLNRIIVFFGGQKVYWYGEAKYWWAILTITSLWKGMGWGSIVYLAALANINNDLYESASLDGASRFQKMWHISVPGMMPIISINLVFGLGGLIKDDFEQILALVGTNQILSRTTTVYSSWIYNQTMGSSSMYGAASALGFFQSVISLLLMVLANRWVKKKDYIGLW